MSHPSYAQSVANLNILNSKLEINKNILTEAYNIVENYIKLIRKIFIKLLILLNSQSSSNSNNTELSHILLLQFRTVNKVVESFNMLKLCQHKHKQLCENIYDAKIQILYDTCENIYHA